MLTIPKPFFIYSVGVFVLFLFMLHVLSAKAVLAVEYDTILIGKDYRIYNLEKGDSMGVCRHACKKDRRCKGWTYIKQRVQDREGIRFDFSKNISINVGGRKKILPPQCRLKFSAKGRKIYNECCTSGVKKVVARNDGGGRCNDYAVTSLNQFDKSLSQGCKFRGRFWHSDYSRHYDWCMDNNNRRSRRQVSKRSDKLQDCRETTSYRDRRVRRKHGRSSVANIWQTMSGNLTQISIGNHRNIWGVNQYGTIFKRVGRVWRKKDGMLIQISAADDGSVWGVTKTAEIFRWTGRGWKKMDGNLTQISVGSRRNIWGVNQYGMIFKRVGRGWRKVSGTLSQISAAADGSVWGVTKTAEIFRWTGRGWKKMDGNLTQISVGSRRNIWGVNQYGEIFKRVGRRWQKVEGTLEQISAAADGSVWGVNQSIIVRKTGSGRINR